jgi:hypothetical protein
MSSTCSWGGAMYLLCWSRLRGSHLPYGSAQPVSESSTIDGNEDFSMLTTPVNSQLAPQWRSGALGLEKWGSPISPHLSTGTTSPLRPSHLALARTYRYTTVTRTASTTMDSSTFALKLPTSHTAHRRTFTGHSAASSQAALEQTRKIVEYIRGIPCPPTPATKRTWKPL